MVTKASTESTESTESTVRVALDTPADIALGRSGDLWVADRGRAQILRIAPDGRIVQHFGLRAPSALALSADERVLFAVDEETCAVWRIDVAAGNSRPVASPPARRSQATRRTPAVGEHFAAHDALLSNPGALALDEDADVLYLAMAGIHQIWRLDIAAGQITVLTGDVRAEPAGAAGASDGDTLDGPFHSARFSYPCGIALAPDRKRLYVADRGHAAVRILHFDDRCVTTLVGAEDALSGCTNLAIGPGGFVLVDSEHDALFGVNPRHRTLVRLRFHSDIELKRPSAVVFDRANHSYVVADPGNHRLVRLMRDMSAATAMRLYRSVQSPESI